MRSQIFLSAIASLALITAVSAQDAPRGPRPQRPRPEAQRVAPDPARIAERRAQFCNNAYARAVGREAETAARLALTDAQKALFDRWRAPYLAEAKDRAARCASGTQQQAQAARGEHGRMTAPERQAAMIAQLQERLAQMRGRLTRMEASQPAFAAFYASLSDTQKAQLDQNGMRAGMRQASGGRPGMGRGFGPGPRPGFGPRRQGA